jgi:plasmid stabilization system protein ParE
MEDAERDLAFIDTQLSQFNIKTAAKFFQELDKKVLLLSEMPYMCPIYPDTIDYRKLVVQDYIALYKVIEENQSVEIHAVWHGRMNIQELIKNLPAN